MKRLFFLLITTIGLSSCGSWNYYTANPAHYQSQFSKDNIVLGTSLVSFLEQYRSSPTKNIKQEGDTIITELNYLEKGDAETYIYSTFRFENGILTEMKQKIDIMKTPHLKCSEHSK